MHSVIPSTDGRYIYASDLGTDLIHQFGVNGNSKKLMVEHLDDVQAKAGSGPRHFSIHPSGQFTFSVEEFGSRVTM